MSPASNILMIRPVNFAFNEQTAKTNAFQNKPEQKDIQRAALNEFDNFVRLLKENGINVEIVEDTPFPHTPDSIFPNNWISFHEDGTIFLYPMQAENRRMERKPQIIEAIRKHYQVKAISDLSYFENTNQFLEGTGSMVLDRENKIAYASISPRTNTVVLAEFCTRMHFQEVHFHSTDANNIPVYHTNVMMCIGSGFAVICMESIKDKAEKEKVEASLTQSHKEIIEINLDQLNKFPGNMIQLSNTSGELFIAMSGAAYNSLNDGQLRKLEKYGKLLYAPLDTIEKTGGGSARCMIAELYLPELETARPL